MYIFFFFYLEKLFSCMVWRSHILLFQGLVYMDDSGKFGIMHHALLHTILGACLDMHNLFTFYHASAPFECTQ